MSLTAVRQFLLFSCRLAVRGIPFNLSSQEDIILPITGTPSYFVGVDFSAEEDTIFFSDTAKDIIYKQKVDGSGKDILLKGCFQASLIGNYLLFMGVENGGVGLVPPNISRTPPNKQTNKQIIVYSFTHAECEDKTYT